MSSRAEARAASEGIVEWYRDWLNRLEGTARARSLKYDPSLFLFDSKDTAEGLLRHSAAIMRWYSELRDGRIAELRQLMRELELIRAIAERIRRGDC
ncbi:MAG: hypothetical protein N3F67_06340 [Acidilobaceae archaeon]|nr:hypothetical protein [Acidilobaceae archaeon]